MPDLRTTKKLQKSNFSHWYSKTILEENHFDFFNGHIKILTSFAEESR